MKPRLMHNEDYFRRLRKKEYSRIDKQGQVYLDYTGGNLYPKSLLNKHFKYLKKAVYGNPHSINPTSILSEQYITTSRKKVLEFFHAHDYHCVFTQNASGALKIVGECYAFSPGSQFLLTADNHNSVNGIREYCRKKGGEVIYSPINPADLSIVESALAGHLQQPAQSTNKLFAFPAQSNVSGVQHSLSWIRIAKEMGWDVLLDAAAFVPTSTLDLSVHKPDFVSISFYKMFGYPTGIGCLLVKKSSFHKLQKPWFAGGTITLSAVAEQRHFLKQDHEKFEDGTVNYLDIPVIAHGLDFLAGIGMPDINNHIKELSIFILSGLLNLRHSNGMPLIKLYGPKNVVKRGGTFLFNFFDMNGQCYPPEMIEQMANANNISLRTGCFCNPGIDEINHALSGEDIACYFSSRSHGDYYDMIRYLGKIRGAVRISIGLPTTKADIIKFIRFARKLINKPGKIFRPAMENVQQADAQLSLLG